MPLLKPVYEHDIWIKEKIPSLFRYGYIRVRILNSSKDPFTYETLCQWLEQKATYETLNEHTGVFATGAFVERAIDANPVIHNFTGLTAISGNLYACYLAVGSGQGYENWTQIPDTAIQYFVDDIYLPMDEKWMIDGELQPTEDADEGNPTE